MEEPIKYKYFHIASHKMLEWRLLNRIGLWASKRSDKETEFLHLYVFHNVQRLNVQY